MTNPKLVFGFGGVAQLGERLPCTQEAIGSNPFTSTTLNLRARVSVAAGVWESVPLFKREGHRFESVHLHHT